jgi:hypothetical protein
MTSRERQAMAKTMSEAPEQGLAVDELIELLRKRAADHGGDKLLEAAAAEIDRLSDLARRVEGDAQDAERYRRMTPTTTRQADGR